MFPVGRKSCGAAASDCESRCNQCGPGAPDRINDYGPGRVHQRCSESLSWSTIEVQAGDGGVSGSASRESVNAPCAAWTGRARWGMVTPRGCPGAKASGRALWQAKGADETMPCYLFGSVAARRSCMRQQRGVSQVHRLQYRGRGTSAVHRTCRTSLVQGNALFLRAMR